MKITDRVITATDIVEGMKKQQEEWDKAAAHIIEPLLDAMIKICEKHGIEIPEGVLREIKELKDEDDEPR